MHVRLSKRLEHYFGKEMSSSSEIASATAAGTLTGAAAKQASEACASASNLETVLGPIAFNRDDEALHHDGDRRALNQVDQHHKELSLISDSDKKQAQQQVVLASCDGCGDQRPSSISKKEQETNNNIGSFQTVSSTTAFDQQQLEERSDNALQARVHGSCHETSSTETKPPLLNYLEDHNKAKAPVEADSNRPSSSAEAGAAQQAEVKTEREEEEEVQLTREMMSCSSSSSSSPVAAKSDFASAKSNENGRCLAAACIRLSAPDGQHTVIELSDTDKSEISKRNINNNNAELHNKPNCLPTTATNTKPINRLPISINIEPVSKSTLIRREEGGDQIEQSEQRHHQSQEDERLELELYKRTRRLSYLQSLLLRRWPCLALAICIMSSLIFGMLLSALSVYYMHALVSDQCHLVAEAASPNHHHHQPLSSVGRPILAHEISARPNPAELASADASIEHLVAVTSLQHQQTDSRVPPHNKIKPDSVPDLSERKLPNELANLTTNSKEFHRLPNTIIPEHYDLFIWPHFDEFNFYGTVKILIDVHESTNKITMHATDLNITSASVQQVVASDAPKRPKRLAADLSNATSTISSTNGQINKSWRDVKPKEQNQEGPKVEKIDTASGPQSVILMLDSKLKAGSKYEVKMIFEGKLNDDLAGFYKIKYERPNSTEPIWIAATQFQATDARRAFPCFDEPLFKATFSIKIKHLRNMTALSNMPITGNEISEDGLWITDSFAKSHRMSTYLVAWAVTNFESRSEGNISVWTRPGFSHTAVYALKIAGKILSHYEQFFGVEYPLPKMDMIALPDFNAGAMENWGLITYRETAMLYDETSSSVANKQRVAVVVAHELAHQWFGNLVTPKWWDDLWLNEGFATFVEYIGVGHVEPKWRMLDQFVVEEVQNVFKVDSLSSSHQISQPVNNPDEINEIFDHISYAKGASLIRMMSHFLTDEVFRLGLQRYLRALKYNNAEQSDLWTHLTEAQRLLAANKNKTLEQSDMVNVERVMNSWTLQTGYPLVTVTRHYSSADGIEPKLGATLEQARYQPYKLIQEQRQKQSNESLDVKNTSIIRDGQPSNSSEVMEKAQQWEIPITYTWKSEKNWSPRTRFWMHQNSSGPLEVARQSMPLDNDEWLILNLNQVGYYRVNYDIRNWRLLISQLGEDHEKIATTNRAQILDDIFDLAKSSLIDYDFAMEATRYLGREREYLPWDSVLLAFSYIDGMLQRTPIYGDWKDYITQLIGPYYERYKNLEWTTNTIKDGSSRNKSQAASSEGPILSIDSNDVLEQYNRANAIAWSCQVDSHCISKAKQEFARWRASGKNSINPALRYTAYCTAIENGDKDDWDFLWRMYELEQNASERDRIMRALGCSKELWILSRYLEWTFDKNKPIRRQDGAYVFRMIAKNNYGRDIAFNFMREHWNTIKDFYGKTSFSLGNLIRSISVSMNTEVELNQLREFYNNIKDQVGVGKRAFQIAIEEAESNVHWRNKNYKIIGEWLQKQKAPSKAPAVAA